MSIPTFYKMRELMAPVWQEQGYQRHILWAGIFGSVSRNRAKESSNVDILIVLKKNHSLTGKLVDLREKLAKACGREISLKYIWQEPDWAWCHARIEALLSSRTVYGTLADVEHLRLEATEILLTGLKRLNLIVKALDNIKEKVIAVQSYENLIHQYSARQECIEEFRKIVDLLDIQPTSHPIRTIFGPDAFESVTQIRAYLYFEERQPGTALIWKRIWNSMQSTSTVMIDLEDGCTVPGRKYIGHVLASKKLADSFEKDLPIDNSMYGDILW